MFICLNCYSIFEYPARRIEKHNLDQPPYETVFVCPTCGNDYYYTQQCIECGQFVKGEYVKTKSGWICDNCFTCKVITDDENPT